MDPYSVATSNPEAPAARPVGDMLPVTHAPETEAQPTAPEMAMQPTVPAMSTAPAATPPPITMPTIPGAATMHATAQAQTATPAVANDLDLIEKEWVEKAKAIVARTRTDPHTQNNEMNVFKADYMKKRYGKDIKLEK